MTQEPLHQVRVFDLQPCPLNKRLCQVQTKCQIHVIKVSVPFREALTGTFKSEFSGKCFGKVSCQFVLSKEVLLFCQLKNGVLSKFAFQS